MRIVYGASYTLGFFQLGTALFPEKTENSLLSVFSLGVDAQDPLIPIYTIVDFSVAVLIIMTFIRFYWATGNIRIYISRKKLENNLSYEIIGRKIMLLHVPILLAHSFTFFIVTTYFKYYTEDGNVNIFLSNNFRVALYCCVFLLALNTVWLFFIARDPSERSQRKFINIIKQLGLFALNSLSSLRSEISHPETEPLGQLKFWLKNNFRTMLLSMVIIVAPFESSGIDLILITLILAWNTFWDLFQSGHVYIFTGYPQ